MNLDELDARIIKEMWLGNIETLTDLAKKIFEIKNSRDLRDKVSLVSKRIKKLERYGFVIEKKLNNRKVYILNTEKCYLGLLVDNQIIWIKLV